MIPLRQLVNTDHVVKNWILSTCFVSQATTKINISLFFFHGKCCMFCSQSQFTLVRKSFLYYRATLSQPSTGICGCKEEFSLEIFVAKTRFRKAAQMLAPVKGELVESHGAHEGDVRQLVVEQLPLLLRRVGNPQPS